MKDSKFTAHKTQLVYIPLYTISSEENPYHIPKKKLITGQNSEMNQDLYFIVKTKKRAFKALFSILL